MVKPTVVQNVLSINRFNNPPFFEQTNLFRDLLVIFHSFFCKVVLIFWDNYLRSPPVNRERSTCTNQWFLAKCWEEKTSWEWWIALGISFFHAKDIKSVVIFNNEASWGWNTPQIWLKMLFWTRIKFHGFNLYIYINIYQKRSWSLDITNCHVFMYILQKVFIFSCTLKRSKIENLQAKKTFKTCNCSTFTRSAGLQPLSAHFQQVTSKSLLLKRHVLL